MTDQQLRKLWKCSCGRKLPTRGRVWNWRWNKFKQDCRSKDEDTFCGYYCDPCADAREAGIDY